jgi:pimeloyl-ACP methyl ester carboxylesterase
MNLSSGNVGDIGFSFSFTSEPTWTFNSGAVNYWGLPFFSAKVFYSNDGTNTLNTTLYLGDSLGTFFPYAIYMETAQPQFQTVEYDFWKGDSYGDPSLQPGSYEFSVTNVSDLLIIGVGTYLPNITAYQKVALLNGYSGVYGYIEQYLDKAYKMDDNGNVTTNATGVVSPYGSFFATDAGVAALMTMPDIDTGERGTGVVYCVSLNVDANHDGNMDLSFSGADATSASKPAQIWVNNNYDRFKWDADDATNYEDDLGPVDIAKLPADQQVPDCQYATNGFPAIPCTRDLEDYFRLWTPGVAALMKALPANYTVQLTLSGNGQIRIFQAVEPDGGTNYLFDETTASNQVANSTSLYVGLLTSSSPIIFNVSTNFNEHFIFCGAAIGSAQIDLQVLDNNGNVVADAPAYLQINDIKQMYERWTVGDDANTTPMSAAVKATDGLQVDASAFQYTPPTDTNTPYILFVHGWNMETWEKDRFAETAFKRLYWQGYQGRFGEFRWPTAFDFTGSLSDLIFDPKNYDNSEFNAWYSGYGLLSKLNDLNAEYPGNVYLMAHSMGNVVAGEALRLTGTNQVVNTYVAMQGAVPAHCYDTNAATRTIPYPFDSGTPNRYAHYYTDTSPNYFNGSAGAGTYVNFFNTNDYALGYWQTDQNLKPDTGFSYSGTNFFAGGSEIDFPSATYEIFAYADEARCYALGAQANVGGVFSISKQLDLFAAPYNFGRLHVGHSLQFRLDYPQSTLFWNTLLSKMKLN